ncbi:MAG: DUF4097 domain-containing protein [Gemmatimonadetes bacterium]|nr:DUF4097 domain-containing protein [Gemmatimonadota bacterium]
MQYAAVVAAASLALGGILVFAGDARSEAASAAPAHQQNAEARPGQEHFRWAGRLARGQQIEVRGVVGDVRAEAASGDQVEVVGRRSGKHGHLVRIEVVEDENGVVVCAIYPVQRGRGNRGNGRGEGPCSGFRGQPVEMNDVDATVDFTVRVPAGVRFAARTVAGDVEATGLRSAVDVATVSGNVRVSTTGTARASTVSGWVEATFGETDGEDMEFASVNGDVVLRLAEGVGAQVSARTVSGEIRSDFDLRRGREDRENGRFHIGVGGEATGTIGRGGPRLRVNTVSGDIRLERVRNREQGTGNREQGTGNRE